MNWAVWGPVLGVIAAALLGLLASLDKSKKDHHAAIAQIDALRIQADAASKQAEAALELARAGTRTAEATAKAAIDDTFTKAYEAASKNWAESNEAQQKWND